MRKLFALFTVLLFAVPFGASLAGCKGAVAVDYCNGNDSGVVVGQLTTVDLEPRLTGYSLNQGQIGQANQASGKDCRGSAVAVTAYTWGTSNMGLVDVEPSNGRLCAGVWNRNTGGGIPDYTTCSSNNQQGVAYITATSGGVASNAVPVFVHPVVTSILLGPASTNCTTDPASNCYATASSNSPLTCTVGPPAVPTNPYSGNSCVSQGTAAQLSARTFAGVGSSQTNISCVVGPLTFTAQNVSVTSIDENGIATALQPGSTIINAAISQASSSVGFYSTCPPATIVLAPAGTTAAPTAPLALSQNIATDLVTTVTDVNKVPITNLSLEYESTNPVTVPVNGAIVTPTFPGSAAITAICQPPTCNSSPIGQIGLFGNGLAVTSNPVLVNATGSGNSTVLYIGSTNSLYLQPYDFTVPTQSAPYRLPYAPNSMVLSTDLSSIYMGTSSELMVFSTLSNQLTRQDTTINGTVLAVSPDSSTVVITDPNRKLIYLYSSTGSVNTEYGGVATGASYSPDSQTVYITTTDGRLLVYSTFTGWNPVALPNAATSVTVTVPNAGVYLANGPFLPETARTNCPVTAVNTTTTPTTTTNTFYPQADMTGSFADLIAATFDGAHILGASASKGISDLKTNLKTGACPVAFTSTSNPAIPFTTAATTAVTGILPTSDSAFAFVTYLGTGSVVPQYSPATGTVTNIVLQKTASGTPIAPVAGVVSSDNQTFYVGTSGDNTVHQLTRTLAGFTDTLPPLTPILPSLTTGTATPNLLVQKPRKSTN